MIRTTPPRFVAIGHLSFDVNVIENGTPSGYIPGGSAAYAALTARDHGFSTGILTSVNEDYPVQDILKGIDVRVSPSEHTSTFANYYDSCNRYQVLLASGSKITSVIIPSGWKEPDIFFAGPLLHELPADCVNWFKPKLSCLVPSGWLRRWGPSGVITHGERLPPTQGRKWNVIVVSEAEIRDLSERYLFDIGEIVCITNGGLGARIWRNDVWSAIPAISAKPIDVTGAGDTWAAAFVIALSEKPNRRDHDIEQAGIYAAAASSIAIESVGMGGCPSRGAVKSRLIEF
jgi:hypothetical protein